MKTFSHLLMSSEIVSLRVALGLLRALVIGFGMTVSVALLALFWSAAALDSLLEALKQHASG